MSQAQFENLSHFLGCYFNQDFDLDGTPDEVIGKYVEQYSGRPQLNSTVKKLRQLLLESYDDSTLKRKLLELGCYYDPTADRWTCSDWLKHVDEMLSSYE